MCLRPLAGGARRAYTLCCDFKAHTTHQQHCRSSPAPAPSAQLRSSLTACGHSPPPAQPASEHEHTPTAARCTAVGTVLVLLQFSAPAPGRKQLAQMRLRCFVEQEAQACFSGSSHKPGMQSLVLQSLAPHRVRQLLLLLLPLLLLPVLLKF